jgi:hypothetical protein
VKWAVRGTDIRPVLKGRPLVLLSPCHACSTPRARATNWLREPCLYAAAQVRGENLSTLCKHRATGLYPCARAQYGGDLRRRRSHSRPPHESRAEPHSRLLRPAQSDSWRGRTAVSPDRAGRSRSDPVLLRSAKRACPLRLQPIRSASSTMIPSGPRT